MVDAPDGAARANGEASASISSSSGEEDTLPVVLFAFANLGQPLLRQLLAATCAGSPRLREASQNAARNLVAWTRNGGAIRALLVLSVGSVTFVALTGLLIFMFFLVAATTNASIVSVLMSLAAAGGFLAVIFAFLAAMYIGTLSVAAFVISATTIATVVAIMIATGWVAFFWILRFAARKCLDLATNRSIGTTSCAVHAEHISISLSQDEM